MEMLITALVTAGVSIVTALGALVVSKINREKSKTEIATLRETIENAEGVYYVTCPQCGTRIFLTGANIKRLEDKTDDR